MGITVDIEKQNRYKFGREMPKPKAKGKGRRLGHIEFGFPHKSYRGLCMCLDSCCQWVNGCVCKTCPCQTGRIEH